MQVFKNITDQTCDTIHQYLKKDLANLIESNNDCLWINIKPSDNDYLFTLSSAYKDDRILTWAQKNIHKNVHCGLVRKGNKDAISSDLYFGGSQSWLVNLNAQCNFMYQYQNQTSDCQINPGEIVIFDPRHEYGFTFDDNIAYTMQFYAFG